MLYTITIKKKLVIDAQSADEARILAAQYEDDILMSGKLAAKEEVITGTRRTTESEKIWFSLKKHYNLNQLIC